MSLQQQGPDHQLNQHCWTPAEHLLGRISVSLRSMPPRKRGSARKWKHMRSKLSPEGRAPDDLRPVLSVHHVNTSKTYTETGIERTMQLSLSRTRAFIPRPRSREKSTSLMLLTRRFGTRIRGCRKTLKTAKVPLKLKPIWHAVVVLRRPLAHFGSNLSFGLVLPSSASEFQPFLCSCRTLCFRPVSCACRRGCRHSSCLTRPYTAL